MGTALPTCTACQRNDALVPRPAAVGDGWLVAACECRFCSASSVVGVRGPSVDRLMLASRKARAESEAEASGPCRTCFDREPRCLRCSRARKAEVVA